LFTKINFIKTLAKEFGFSDHTIGIEIAKIALSYKIDYLEKHFTIDNSLPGRDNKFAILPHQLKDLVLFKSKINLLKEKMK
jgi:sialic acid synthase SpsE